MGRPFLLLAAMTYSRSERFQLIRSPSVVLQLDDAQRQAAVLRLDAEYNRLHLLALLQDLGGMLDALGPAQVRHVNQAVDAVFDLDEGTEVREVANAAFDDSAGRVLVFQLL